MSWLHFVVAGIVLGWGAAIPIGPMNLEMMRRNLCYGTRYGVGLGLGACLADVTYLGLLSFGLIAIFQHPAVFRTIGVAGILVLLIFAYLAFRSIKTQVALRHTLNTGSHDLGATEVEFACNETTPLWRHFIAGYSLTLINAYTIIFWTTISTQVAAITDAKPAAIWWVGAGLLAGTVSWVLTLNTLLHYTRHKLSPRVMIWFNAIGSSLLLVFAGLAVYHFFWR